MLDDLRDNEVVLERQAWRKEIFLAGFYLGGKSVFLPQVS